MEKNPVSTIVTLAGETALLLGQDHPPLRHEGGGFSVRSNLRAGEWQCRSCSGDIQGRRMIRPNCDFCQYV